jgi:hypothetical protein
MRMPGVYFIVGFVAKLARSNTIADALGPAIVRGEMV